LIWLARRAGFESTAQQVAPNPRSQARRARRIAPATPATPGRTSPPDDLGYALLHDVELDAARHRSAHDANLDFAQEKKSKPVKLPGILAQGETSKTVLGHYWQRHELMRQCQAQSRKKP
jgi:hypothetical protein